MAEVTALCVVSGLFVIWMGAPYLLGLFGPAFAAQYWTLIVLALGTAFQAAGGPAGAILQLTGHESGYVPVVAANVVLRLLGFLIFIPWLGVLGAALSATVSLAIATIALNVLCRRRTGVDPSVLVLFRASSLEDQGARRPPPRRRLMISLLARPVWRPGGQIEACQQAKGSRSIRPDLSSTRPNPCASSQCVQPQQCCSAKVTTDESQRRRLSTGALAFRTPNSLMMMGREKRCCHATAGPSHLPMPFWSADPAIARSKSSFASCFRRAIASGGPEPWGRRREWGMAAP